MSLNFFTQVEGSYFASWEAFQAGWAQTTPDHANLHLSYTGLRLTCRDNTVIHLPYYGAASNIDGLEVLEILREVGKTTHLRYAVKDLARFVSEADEIVPLLEQVNLGTLDPDYLVEGWWLKVFPSGTRTLWHRDRAVARFYGSSTYFHDYVIQKSEQRLSELPALIAYVQNLEPKPKQETKPMTQKTLQTRIVQAEKSARYRPVARKLAEEAEQLIEQHFGIPATHPLGQTLTKLTVGVGLHLGVDALPDALKTHADKLSDEFLTEAGAGAYIQAYDLLAKPLAERFIQLAATHNLEGAEKSE